MNSLHKDRSVNSIVPGCSVLLLTLSFLAAGCGGGGVEIPPLAPVQGVVTLDGEPISGATVIFEPQFEAHQAVGATDTEGKFNLMYHEGVSGAALGNYKVRIFHYGEDEELPTEGLIPEKYGAQSELTADVKEGDNDFTFELKGE